MIYNLIIGVAALFGLFRLFRTSDIFAKTILAGQIVAIIITLLNDNTRSTIGLLLFMLTLVLAIIYGLVEKKLNPLKRTLIVLSSFLVFVMYFFQLQNYPGAGPLGLAMVVPIFSYAIWILTDKKNYQNELGFLTILAAVATIEFLRRIEWLLNSASG